MVALRATDVEGFIARPDPGQPVVLIYGADAGLVSERAAALVRASVADPGDPFALAVLSAEALADIPERLVEEAHTVPLFGGRRAVHVKAAGRNIQAAVERVLAAPPPGTACRIIIESGDLRKTAPLRTLCEKSAVAAALPCYPDTPRDLARLIDDETRRAAMAIAPAARDLLSSLLGGDRRASRSEIDKLILYAAPGSRIDVADVMAVVSDATNPAIDGLIDAAFAGLAGEVESQFAKVQASGTAASTIAGALVRNTAALHMLRLSVESGAPIDDLLKRQAVHFSRTRAVRAALQAWTAGRLERLIGQLGDISLEVRRNSRLAYPAIERALLMIARAARSRR
jgi:DNA polymerase III subunit delta